MNNYIDIKNRKNNGKLKQVNKKSNELKNNSKDIKDKINKLKVSKLNDLKGTLEYFKDKFCILISFLHKKLHSWYNKDDKYIDVVNEMYEDNILDEEDIKELNLSKEKDDFEK